MGSFHNRLPTRFLWIIFATAICFLLSATAVVCGAGSVQILEQDLQDDTIILYLKQVNKVETASVQIGSIQAEDAIIDGYDGDIPTRSWLLIDNSQSIPKEDRGKILELFSDLVAGRMKNETFNLCTFDEHLQILLEDSQSYPALKAAIESIEYKTQETYLTDVLNELLDREKAKKEPGYVRVILVCDGGETNDSGLTREELNQRLASENIPIYVLGCKLNNNEQSLNDMYALSRMTGARSWTLTEMDDTLSIAEQMSTSEAPVRATISIPEEAKDGASKGIKLSFADGSTAVAQMTMPFGTPQEEDAAPSDPAPTPTPVPEPITAPTPVPEPEPVPEPNSGHRLFLLILVGAVLLVAAAAAAAIVLLRRKREKNQIKQVNCPENPISNETVLLGMNSYDDSETMILVNTDNRFMLRLTDTEDPGSFYEAALFDIVSIGRNPENQIVIKGDKSVSSIHCEISVKGSSFRLRDLNSRNGTYLNGSRITDETELANGNKIRIGRREYILDLW